MKRSECMYAMRSLDKLDKFSESQKTDLWFVLCFNKLMVNCNIYIYIFAIFSQPTSWTSFRTDDLAISSSSNIETSHWAFRRSCISRSGPHRHWPTIVASRNSLSLTAFARSWPRVSVKQVTSHPASASKTIEKVLKGNTFKRLWTHINMV